MNYLQVYICVAKLFTSAETTHIFKKNKVFITGPPVIKQPSYHNILL